MEQLEWCAVGSALALDIVNLGSTLARQMVVPTPPRVFPEHGAKNKSWAQLCVAPKQNINKKVMESILWLCT